MNLSQNVIHADQDTGQCDPGGEGGLCSVPGDGDAAVDVHPGVESFDFPSALIASDDKASGGASRSTFAAFPFATRDDRLDVPLSKCPSQGHRVITAIGDQSCGTLLRTTTTAVHADLIQHGQHGLGLMHRGGGHGHGQW